MIAGLVLAAGAGRRFGPDSKLLADLHGRPLLEYAIRAQCAVPELERVVVVLGAHASAVIERVDFARAEPAVCRDWEDGQAASLRCGVAALSGASKALVTLGDEPLLSVAVITRLVAQPAGARAVFAGRPGHPVVLGREQLDALKGLRGDQGARDLLRGGPEIECSDLGPARDVDTSEDLEAVRRCAGGQPRTNVAP